MIYDSTILFDIIHGSYCIISANFYLYLQYFQLKDFSFSKINSGTFIFAIIHGSIVLFGTIHGSHCTISANFYFYLQYFQQKVFSFSKINRFQTDSKLL